MLKQHSAESPEEMALLHPADRLMLRLIKIPHLADRIKGMLYQVSFDETAGLLEKVSSIRVAPKNCTTPDYASISISGYRFITRRMLRSQTRHSVQGTSQCYSDDGELHERVELRRRSIWIQDCQHQQGELSVSRVYLLALTLPLKCSWWIQNHQMGKIFCTF